ncbi:hypothetical protein J2S05_000768 [Alkalicoccobacillus murimartini]|uniref:Uncharacterized protein n=1 Tax=Alkalicoccobacillus murimartini TaxID=171685 RepID=A0ABT9YG07_9BACI|nr:hypothetical protein [Alkalicoccobacillus murimartini]
MLCNTFIKYLLLYNSEIYYHYTSIPILYYYKGEGQMNNQAEEINKEDEYESPSILEQINDYYSR